MSATEYLDLTETAKQAPRHIHASTVWRWARKGVLSRAGVRVRLEHVRAGGRVLIPTGALDRFFRQLAEADQEHFSADLPPTPPKPTTNAQRAKSIERAEKVLQAGGIL